jgi:D-alanyl-lipoteichoic acid acyltransferase DltB (MBOAT superfamily)
MENFRRPYLSRSISDFWKRWHISLSTWFRDYLYIPLGGNKVSKWRWYFNLFIVFLISGLWHGANWTFVVWGALHGAYLVCSLWTSEMRVKVVRFFGLNRLPTVHRYLQIFITFHLVLLGWIFFRANSISDAFLLLTNMFHIELLDINPAHLSIDVADGMGTEELIIAFFSVLFLIAVHMFEESRGSVRTIISSKPLIFRWALYVMLVLAILNLGMPQEIPFIYFQF